MPLISRRRLLYASGAAACLPLTDVVVPSLVSAQTISAGAIETSAPVATKFSPELAKWSQSAVLKSAVKVTNGTGTSKHWATAAHAVRAYAKHLEATGIDQASDYLAKVVSKASGDQSKHPVVEQLYQHLQSSGSTVSRQELTEKLQFSPSTIQKAAASVKTNGYSFQFHQIADAFQSVSATLEARELASKGVSIGTYLPVRSSHGVTAGHLQSAQYHPSHPAHLIRVSGKLCSAFKGVAKALGLSDQMKDNICDALTDGSIVAGAATGAVAANIVCDGLVILSVVATDGVAATIAGPLESLVCGALTVYTGAAVTTLMAAMSCALNC